MTRNSRKEQLENYTVQYGEVCKENNRIDIDLYDQYGVKRGLRDKNGEGVLAGLTNISWIKSQEMIDGKRVPCEGRLLYRGYDIIDLVRGSNTVPGMGLKRLHICFCSATCRIKGS